MISAVKTRSKCAFCHSQPAQASKPKPKLHINDPNEVKITQVRALFLFFFPLFFPAVLFITGTHSHFKILFAIYSMLNGF